MDVGRVPGWENVVRGDDCCDGDGVGMLVPDMGNDFPSGKVEVDGRKVPTRAGMVAFVGLVDSIGKAGWKHCVGFARVGHGDDDHDSKKGGQKRFIHLDM